MAFLPRNYSWLSPEDVMMGQKSEDIVQKQVKNETQEVGLRRTGHPD